MPPDFSFIVLKCELLLLTEKDPGRKNRPMGKYADENVLVIPRSLFDELGAFEGFCTNISNYLPFILNPQNNFFLNRELAEDDPGHKQIIPYSIFHHGGQILHYYRGGGSGEKRLAAKGSIGIGGHINDTDFSEAALDQCTYTNGIEREIREELEIGCSYTQRIIGLLNDDSNDVGKVHLGVVHLITLDGLDVRAAEDNISNLEFRSFRDLKASQDQLESWSSICLNVLDQFLDLAS
jgi:predicted NUDIX family phosphoesterase